MKSNITDNVPSSIMYGICAELNDSFENPEKEIKSSGIYFVNSPIDLPTEVLLEEFKKHALAKFTPTLLDWFTINSKEFLNFTKAEKSVDRINYSTPPELFYCNGSDQFFQIIGSRYREYDIRSALIIAAQAVDHMCMNNDHRDSKCNIPLHSSKKKKGVYKRLAIYTTVHEKVGRTEFSMTLTIQERNFTDDVFPTSNYGMVIL